MGDGSTSMRWGFIGPGNIANNVAHDLPKVGGGSLHAVGSRSIARARAFATEHDVPVAYGSYGDLLADADVDAVYIATPHRQHHAVAMAAIAAGKHVLIEKAFTSTLAGAREIVAAARTAGVFCMEAMWTRFQPAMVEARRLLDDGAIGEVRSARADLGVRYQFDPTSRLWDHGQGGGALLDLGVYTASFVQSVLGRTPQRVDVAGAVAGNGVDAESVLLWHGDDGRTGVAQCSFLSPLPGAAAVFGTAGWLEIPPRFHHPDRVTMHPIGPDGRAGAPDTIVAEPIGTGYAHEFIEVQRCVVAGLTESPIMPLDDTLAIMSVLEHALHTLGVYFDEDDEILL